MGRLPHQTSPRHLPWNPQDNSCWYLGTGWHLNQQPLCLTTGPRVSLFRFSLFLFTFPFSNWELFPHIMNVAARVCRSPDSWAWSDHPQISLTHSPTPPQCSTRALMALINNLGIVYHQYCSSSIVAVVAIVVGIIPRFGYCIHCGFISRFCGYIWGYCGGELFSIFFLFFFTAGCFSCRGVVQVVVLPSDHQRDLFLIVNIPLLICWFLAENTPLSIESGWWLYCEFNSILTNIWVEGSFDVWQPCIGIVSQLMVELLFAQFCIGIDCAILW